MYDKGYLSRTLKRIIVVLINKKSEKALLISDRTHTPEVPDMLQYVPVCHPFFTPYRYDFIPMEAQSNTLPLITSSFIDVNMRLKTTDAITFQGCKTLSKKIISSGQCFWHLTNLSNLWICHWNWIPWIVFRVSSVVGSIVALYHNVNKRMWTYTPVNPLASSINPAFSMQRTWYFLHSTLHVMCDNIRKVLGWWMLLLTAELYNRLAGPCWAILKSLYCFAVLFNLPVVNLLFFVPHWNKVETPTPIWHCAIPVATRGCVITSSLPLSLFSVLFTVAHAHKQHTYCILYILFSTQCMELYINK